MTADLNSVQTTLIVARAKRGTTLKNYFYVLLGQLKAEMIRRFFSPFSGLDILRTVVHLRAISRRLITSGSRAQVGAVTDGKLWAFVYLFELGSMACCTGPMKTETQGEIKLLLCTLTGSGMLTLGILAAFVGTDVATPQDWVRLERRGSYFS
jgi:hypothetical protein